jgi:hypothetical protein
MTAELIIRTPTLPFFSEWMELAQGELSCCPIGTKSWSHDVFALANENPDIGICRNGSCPDDISGCFPYSTGCYLLIGRRGYGDCLPCAFR